MNKNDYTLELNKGNLYKYDIINNKTKKKISFSYKGSKQYRR